MSDALAHPAARLAAIASALAVALGAVACGDSSTADGDGQGDPVTTNDPVTTFAPLVHLHSKEKWFPISAKEFVDYATVSWAIDGCSDETIATGAPRLRLNKDAKTQATDVRRLGSAQSPYAHRTRQTPACRKRRPTSYTATQHTRPYDEDRDERPAGLPAGDGFYLDLMTERLYGKRKLESRRPQEILADVPVYYTREPEQVDGGRGLRLTYWLLYGVNETPGKAGKVPTGHEGDWERVAVLLERGDRKGSYVPISVRFVIDGRARDVPWQDVERVDDRAAPGGGAAATHPVVFAARGNHSPYPTAGDHPARVRGEGRTFEVTDQAQSCPRCVQWRTWADVLDARAQPWYGFGGSWGYVDFTTGTPGPLGPSRFAR